MIPETALTSSPLIGPNRRRVGWLGVSACGAGAGWCWHRVSPLGGVVLAPHEPGGTGWYWRRIGLVGGVVLAPRQPGGTGWYWHPMSPVGGVVLPPHQPGRRVSVRAATDVAWRLGDGVVRRGEPTRTECGVGKRQASPTGP
ncbi:hypothetical protein Aph02nite_58130 [Actinoplanes philippinensis]|nr:hypothetical protein Aph02nite_58130 [Actinoplanes philippinensis]